MINLFSCLPDSLNGVIMADFELPGSHECLRRGVLPRCFAGLDFGILLVRLNSAGQFAVAEDEKEDADFFWSNY